MNESTQIRDVFLCHSSEDKPLVVRPLAKALEQAGLTYWLDEAEIVWGDSILAKINHGLAKSRYVVVVLGNSFRRRNWPQHELYAAMHDEISSGQVKVLPLLVGNDQEKAEILHAYPLLQHKRYLSWEGDVSSIIDALFARLGKERRPEIKETKGEKVDIPLPKIRKKFTQRDRDIFLPEAFFFIRNYFSDGLSELRDHNSQVETALENVSTSKFTCIVYVNGEVHAKCKIWIGDQFSNSSTLFRTGDTVSGGDSAFNESLSIEDEEGDMGLRPLGMAFSQQRFIEGKRRLLTLP